MEEQAGPTTTNEIGDLIFNPPVYRQRRTAAMDLARELQPKKVVDMGCGECSIMKCMRMAINFTCIEELIGVDISAEALERGRLALEPECLIKREHPFAVQLLRGSISQPDHRVRNPDLLICLEVIEHLNFGTLRDAPRNIFGYIRPTVAMISTPNADFNVLFPNMKGFRHYDHKFEWTRNEFQSWCSDICQEYGYTVAYSGLGTPPPAIPLADVGHSTQIATFTKVEGACSKYLVPLLDEPYEEVFYCKYPYNKNPIPHLTRVYYEARLLLKALFRYAEDKFLNADDDYVKEPYDPNIDPAEAAKPLSFAEPLSDKYFKCEKGRIEIQMRVLLKYPKILSLTNTIDYIGCALVEHGSSEFILSLDGETGTALVTKIPDDSDDEADEENNSGDNNDIADDQEQECEVEHHGDNAEENWVPLEQAQLAVTEEDWDCDDDHEC